VAGARYTQAQVGAIARAVRAGRDAAAGADDGALAFAAAFVAAGGVQVPGAEGDDAGAERIATALLEALRGGALPDGDDVRREIARARAEAAWAAASERVVGFRLQPGPRAAAAPEVRALAGTDHGLGAGVVPKTRVVVLPPDCDDCAFVPVTDDDVEQ